MRTDLKSLQGEQAAPYDYAEFERRRRLRTHTRRSRRWRVMATAAGFALLIMTAAIWSRLHTRMERQLVASDVSVAPQLVPSAGLNPQTVDASAWLAQQPAEQVVVRAGAYYAVAQLEDQIASVDDLLNFARSDRTSRPATSQAHVAALLATRERLVGSLAEVRYAEQVSAQWR